MRKIFFVFIILVSCNSNKPEYSIDQIRFQKKLRYYSDLVSNYDLTTGKLTKSEFRNVILDSLHQFIVDSQNYILKNFTVTFDKMGIDDIGEIRALTARFSDASANTYWMEFDYKRDSFQLIQDNPAYKLLKDLQPNSKQVLSFLYMGDIKWNSLILTDYVDMRVVPFPKNFNFDSAKNVSKIIIN